MLKKLQMVTNDINTSSSSLILSSKAKPCFNKSIQVPSPKK